MMSMPPAGSYPHRLRNDRSSLQLRAYLRQEYGSDLEWIQSMIRFQSVPLRTRLRGWFRARASKRESRSRDRTPEPAPSSPTPRWLAEVDTCAHLLTEDLGVGGAAEFLRCTLCGGVLVVRGNRRWRIGRPDGESARSPLDRPSEDYVSAPQEEAEIC